MGSREEAAEPGLAVVLGGLVGAVVAVVRLVRGGRPRAVLFGLLGVAVAALIALYTGRAVDFFLVQIVSNAASALAWAVSIVVRWPLLGLVVGTVLGQRTSWRRDPRRRARDRPYGAHVATRGAVRRAIVACAPVGTPARPRRTAPSGGCA